MYQDEVVFSSGTAKNNFLEFEQLIPYNQDQTHFKLVLEYTKVPSMLGDN